jgi:hypothetical protein
VIASMTELRSYAVGPANKINAAAGRGKQGVLPRK